jgi:hypothetical protein
MIRPDCRTHALGVGAFLAARAAKLSIGDQILNADPPAQGANIAGRMTGQTVRRGSEAGHLAMLNREDRFCRPRCALALRLSVVRLGS